MLLKTAVICMISYLIACHGAAGILYKMLKGKKAQLHIMTIKYAATEEDCVLHCLSLNRQKCNFNNTACELLSDPESTEITLFENSNWTYMCELCPSGFSGVQCQLGNDINYFNNF